MTSYIFYYLIQEIPGIINNKRIKLFYNYKATEIVSCMDDILCAFCGSKNRVDIESISKINRVDLNDKSNIAYLYSSTEDELTYLTIYDRYYESTKKLIKLVDEIVLLQSYISLEKYSLYLELRCSLLLDKEMRGLLREYKKIDFTDCNRIFIDFYIMREKINNTLIDRRVNNG